MVDRLRWIIGWNSLCKIKRFGPSGIQLVPNPLPIILYVKLLIPKLHCKGSYRLAFFSNCDILYKNMITKKKEKKKVLYKANQTNAHTLTIASVSWSTGRQNYISSLLQAILRHTEFHKALGPIQFQESKDQSTVKHTSTSHKRTTTVNHIKKPSESKKTCKKLRPGRHLSRPRNFVTGPSSPC